MLTLRPRHALGSLFRALSSSAAGASSVSNPFFVPQLSPPPSDGVLLSRLIPALFDSPRQRAPDPELLQAAASSCHTRADAAALEAAFVRARADPRGYSLATFEAQLLLMVAGRLGDISSTGAAVLAAVTRGRGDTIGPALKACCPLLLRGARNMAEVASALASAQAVEAGVTAAVVVGGNGSEAAALHWLTSPMHLPGALEALLAAGRDDLGCNLVRAAAARHGRLNALAQLSTAVRSSWLRAAAADWESAARAEAEVGYGRGGFLAGLRTFFNSDAMASAVLQSGRHDFLTPEAGLRASRRRFLAWVVSERAAAEVEAAAAPPVSSSAGAHAAAEAVRRAVADICDDESAGGAMLGELQPALLALAASAAARNGTVGLARRLCHYASEAAALRVSRSEGRPVRRAHAALAKTGAALRFEAALAVALQERRAIRAQTIAESAPSPSPPALLDAIATLADVAVRPEAASLAPLDVGVGLALLLAVAADAAMALAAPDANASTALQHLRHLTSTAALLRGSRPRGWLADGELALILSAGAAVACRFPAAEADAARAAVAAVLGAAPAVAEPRDIASAALSAEAAAVRLPDTKAASVQGGHDDGFMPLASVYGDPSSAIVAAALAHARNAGSGDNRVDDVYARFAQLALFPPVYTDPSAHVRWASAAGGAVTSAGGAFSASRHAELPRPPAPLFDRVDLFDPTVLDDGADASLVFEARTRLRVYGGWAVGRQALAPPDALIDAENNAFGAVGHPLLDSAAAWAVATGASPVALLLPAAGPAMLVLVRAVSELLRDGGQQQQQQQIAEPGELACRRIAAAGETALREAGGDVQVEASARFLVNVALHACAISPRPTPVGGGGSSSGKSVTASSGANGGDAMSAAALGPGAAALLTWLLPLDAVSTSAGKCATTSSATLEFALQCCLRPTAGGGDAVSREAVAYAADIVLAAGIRGLGMPKSPLLAQLLSLCAAHGLQALAERAAARRFARMPGVSPGASGTEEFATTEGKQGWRWLLDERAELVPAHELVSIVKDGAGGASAGMRAPLCAVAVEVGEPMSWALRAAALYAHAFGVPAALTCVLPYVGGGVSVDGENSSRAVLDAAHAAIRKGLAAEGAAAGALWLTSPLRTRAVAEAVAAPPTALLPHLMRLFSGAGQPLAASAVYWHAAAAAAPAPPAGLDGEAVCTTIEALCRARMFADAAAIYARHAPAAAGGAVPDRRWALVTRALAACGARLASDLSAVADRLAQRVQQSLVLAAESETAAAAAAAAGGGAESLAGDRDDEAHKVDGDAEVEDDRGRRRLPVAALLGLAMEDVARSRAGAAIAGSVPASHGSVAATVPSHEDAASDVFTAPKPLHLMCLAHVCGTKEDAVLALRAPGEAAPSAAAGAEAAARRSAGRLVTSASILGATFANSWLLLAAALPSLPPAAAADLHTLCDAVAFRRSASGRQLARALLDVAGPGPAAAIGSGSGIDGIMNADIVGDALLRESIAWCLAARGVLLSAARAAADDVHRLALAARPATASGTASASASTAAVMQEKRARVSPRFVSASMTIACAAGRPADALVAYQEALQPLRRTGSDVCSGGGGASVAATQQLIRHLCADVAPAARFDDSRWRSFESTPGAVARSLTAEGASPRAAAALTSLQALTEAQSVANGRAALPVAPPQVRQAAGCANLPPPRVPGPPPPDILAAAAASAPAGRVTVPARVIAHLTAIAAHLRRTDAPVAARNKALLSAAETLYQLLQAPAPETTQALLAAQDRRYMWRSMDTVFTHMRATGTMPLAP